MSCQQDQEEEADVLLSIYEGDERFKQVSPTQYHYRYGEQDSCRALVAEICWTDNYPNEAPQINLDLFANRHLLPEIREVIRNKLLEQAEANIGMPMTYTLFEWLKENNVELMEAQPERVTECQESSGSRQNDEGSPAHGDGAATQRKDPKKEKLSKSQKRKLAGRVVHGELPRGHDWVDVLKHLLQSGSAG